MTSLSTSISSARSVRDAFASYRRAQCLVAGSAVAAASESSDFEDDDEEAIRVGIEYDSDYDEYEELPIRTMEMRDDAPLVGQLSWDEDYDSQNIAQQYRQPHSPRGRSLYPTTTRGRRPLAIGLPSREDTPLLGKRVSFSTPPTHRSYGENSRINEDYAASAESVHLSVPTALSHRRPSSTSMRSGTSVRHNFGGKSTFGQTLFNSIAILLGIGMLSEPLAFSYSGWILGTVQMVVYGFLACYTAKILAKIILSDHRLRSYSDIGRKAFGPRSTIFISIMFTLELFAVSVILVTLYADSLHTILPLYSANTYKVWGAIVLVPTVFLPLSLLSYTSVLGIISTILMVVVVFIDGFSKKEGPGSLWDPAPTDIGVKSVRKLGVSLGLFIAGFSGHVVIPSLARDMIDPSQFDKMINWAFVVATFIYTVIGYAGYLMFGNAVSDEISVDLLKTKGYNPGLNKFLLWLLVISPLSKFALNVQPLNTTIEILLGLDTPIPAPEDVLNKSDSLSTSSQGQSPCVSVKRLLAILQRVVITLLCVAISILVPEFSSMMAFLGSFSAFMLCLVGPIAAKVMLEGHCGVFDGVVIFSGIIMAIWGTGAAFWPS